jgi:hypothetical protein
MAGNARSENHCNAMPRLRLSGTASAVASLVHAGDQGRIKMKDYKSVQTFGS